METNPFILALSKTLPESCLQGLAVYLILQLLFYIDKRSTPSLKFNLYYVANLCLFAGFVLTFFHHYQQSQITSFNPNLLPNKIGDSIPTIISKPNLWLQFSFWTSNYAYLITGFYLLGLLFCVLKLAIGIINISWFRNNKNLKLDSYLSNISNQLSSNFRLIKTVSVYLSDQICVPLTIGFIKPIIVFPIALVNQLSAEQTEAILLHELAHIKRNDYLLNIFLCIVQSFLFFNPIVWLMKREINKYREQCCDDLVLDNTQHKIAYAHALLLIEESRNTQLTLALASNGKKYTLLNRIKRITNMKINEPSPQNKLVVLLLALITIGISVAWNMPVKKVLKQSTNRHLTSVTIVETKPDSSKFKLAANKMLLVHKAAPDSSKIEMVADTIFIEHQLRNKPNQKLTFQGKGIIYDPSADTIIKSKNKFKIVLEDSVGNKKEYNSIDELPADAQKEFLKENSKLNGFQKVDFDFKFPDSNKFVYNFNNKFHFNPQSKKQAEIMRKQAEVMRQQIQKQFSSPEWKKQMEDIKVQGEEIRKQFNSPEFKKQMADIKVQGEEIQKQFNSPEWKKQIENINKLANEATTKYFNSPEWKKQEESMKNLSIKLNMPYNSKKWKKQMEDLRKSAVDSDGANWKKSLDEQRKLVPEKAGKPGKL